jgi:tRNA A-37 threonylcarbamoyl transferase component Bud32
MTSAWTAVTAGGIRWHVAPEYHQLLLAKDGLPLASWLREGKATVIKRGPHRQVFRVELPGLSCYVKRNLVPDIKTWLRQLVRPSKARMELDRILALRARNIPTVEPLALGEQQGFLGIGDSYLVTRTLEGTEQLNALMARNAAFAESRRRRIRQALAVELGRFVGRLHAAGIRHDDLHAANLLVRLHADDRPELFLIDLNAVTAGAALSWCDRRDNLVLLNRWFVPRSRRTDRLRFWRAYYEASGAGVWPTDAAGPREHFARARDVEEHTWISSRVFWTDRDRRCLRSNRYYRKVSGPSIAGHAVTDLDEDALTELIADPDQPFNRPRVPLLKNSRGSTITEMDIRVGGVLRRVIYKRFRVTTWTDPWRSLVRRSPALRSWFFGQALRERCVPTARPLAVLHRRRHGMHYEGYLVTEKIDGACDLGAMLHEIAVMPHGEARRRLRGHIDDVARAVRELHRWRFSHRDLKAANVLVSRDGAAAAQPSESSDTGVIPNYLPWPAAAVWLIDLVGVRSLARLPRGRKIQNLARLNASFAHSALLTRTDRLRFLRVYLQWGLRGRDGWKSWWRGIAAATTAKVRRNLRGGRPLA